MQILDSTAYSMAKKLYGERHTSVSLKRWKDTSNFYVIYIQQQIHQCSAIYILYIIICASTGLYSISVY